MIGTDESPLASSTLPDCHILSQEERGAFNVSHSSFYRVVVVEE